MKKLIAWVKTLPHYASKPWYPFVLCIFAFVDYLIFLVPLDGMVVASIVARRKRWFSFSFWASVGSTLGAWLFAWVINQFGIAVLLKWHPTLMEDRMAVAITQWLHDYGHIVLVGVGMLPVAQHPTVAVAALAGIPMWTIIVTQFLGRFFKYCIYTWLSTHAKRWFLKFFKEEK